MSVIRPLPSAALQLLPAVRLFLYLRLQLPLPARSFLPAACSARSAALLFLHAGFLPLPEFLSALSADFPAPPKPLPSPSVRIPPLSVIRPFPSAALPFLPAVRLFLYLRFQLPLPARSFLPAACSSRSAVLLFLRADFLLLLAVCQVPTPSHSFLLPASPCVPVHPKAAGSVSAASGFPLPTAAHIPAVRVPQPGVPLLSPPQPPACSSILLLFEIRRIKLF